MGVANRKHRTTEPSEPSSTNEATKPDDKQQKPAAPPASSKSASRFAFLFWGIPFLLFVIIAVIKECK